MKPRRPADRFSVPAVKIHPHAWLWEPLGDEPSFVLRSMFGAKAVYLDGKLMLAFCSGDEPWRGVLVCTAREHHTSLLAQFPELRPHPILPKWLYLTESAPQFETLATALVRLAQERDSRLGVLPQPKRPRRAQAAPVRPSAVGGEAPLFFASATDFRRWLKKNHARTRELFVGFYKKHAAQGGLTYREAVEEALCFGWIDGLVRRLDADRYQHRFTPRRPDSIWSKVNVAQVERLIREGRMHAAGLAAFAARTAAKTGVYSFEQKNTEALPAAAARAFRRNAGAWAFFRAQPPWYRRFITHKIVNSKLAATRERWLQRAIQASAAGQRL